jgi:hydrogenase expression/formation protein HypD
MRYLDEFRSPELARPWIESIRAARRTTVLMEVCGTHTMAIARAGLRPLLAPAVELVSGPGCPVCVTGNRDIDRAMALAWLPGVIVATFGDMMRVPGSAGTLADAAARGGRVQVVYSPLDALELARREPGARVVFLGVGFETTAPATAGCLLKAKQEGLDNFYLLSLHKLVPPALRALAALPDLRVDGFILPGHVSAVIGSDAYTFLPAEFGIPCVVAGFETVDVLQAIRRLQEMQEEGPAVEIAYRRVVKPGGNPRAMEVMREVFEESPADWRGLGPIPASGLVLREEWRRFDASTFEVELPEPAGDRGCRCGEVLVGRIKPPQCSLFAGGCTPEHPIGPCMVSTEGTCASYYLYERDEDE